MIETVLAIACAGLLLALITLISKIAKMKDDLTMLHAVAHSKLNEVDFHKKGIQFGYMRGTRDALDKLKEYF